MCFLLNNNKKILSFRLPCFCNPTTQVSTEPESGAGREISFFHRRFNTENVTEAHYSPALPKAENPCRAGQMSSFLFPGLCNKGCLVRIQGLLSTSELVRPRNTSQILVNYCSRKGSKAVCQFPLLPSPPPQPPFKSLEIKSRALLLGGKGFTLELWLSPVGGLFTVSRSFHPWMPKEAFLVPYGLALMISLVLSHSLGFLDFISIPSP